MRQWDAVRAVPDAVVPGDIIRVRDAGGIKRFRVYLVGHGYYLGHKQCGSKWNKTRGRAYHQNVVAPLIVPVAEPESAVPATAAVCPRDGGSMYPAASFKPPINYEGWICVGCGHKHAGEAPVVLEATNGVE